MRPPTKILLSAILAALPGLAVSTEVVIDEISVTATRRTAAATEVASALGVVAREEIEFQNLVTDALAWQPGVALQQTTPGQGAAIVRGLKGSAILHLVDGMRLSNAIFRSAPTPYLALVPVAAVERIEIIRGTPASLYGSEAVGGAILVVTRQPGFEAGLRRTVSVGADTADLSRSLSAGLEYGDARIAALLSGEYHRTGDRRTGHGPRVGPSAFSARALRAALRARHDDNSEWQLDLQLLEQPETPRFDELVPGFGQTEPSSSEFLFAPSQRLFARVGYERRSASDRPDLDVDLAWQRVVDDRVSRNFGAATRRFEDNHSDLFGLSISLAGQSGRFDWVTGTDIYYDEVRSSRQEENIADASVTEVTPRFPDGATVEQYAAFGKVDWHPTDNSTLSIGLRYTHAGIDLPATALSPASRIDTGNLSGDLGLLYEMDSNWQVVANIGYGFRAPNVFDLGTLGERPGNRFNVPNSGLDAEYVTHGDVGIRRHGDGWHAELFVYALRYEDRVTSVLTGDTTPDGRDIVQSVNAATSTIRGAEAGFRLDLGGRTSLQAVVNYAWGETRIPGGATEPGDRIPPLSGRVGLVFTPSDAWRFEGWIAAAETQDRLSPRDVRDVRIDPAGTPGWASVGAGVLWQPGADWHIAIGVDNLLDHRYREHGSGIDAPGRNLWLDVRRNW